MKTYLILCLFLSSICFANTNETESSLKEVTVYLDGAQITRTATIQLPVGTSEYTFHKLSPYIQESSIQVSGLQNASILSINYGINYLSKQPKTKEIETLQEQIKSINDQIQFEDDLIAGYKEELSIIQQNRHLGSDTQVVSLEKLKQFAAYYRQRITEVNTLIYESYKKKRDYEDEINDIRKQLQEYNVEEKVQTGEIKVKFNTAKPTSLNITLKYNVSNAGWFPTYDLKANSINTPIDMQYKAHVYQNTGVDWNDIKVTLSTSDPNTNNEKPDLDPKYLNFISRNSHYERTRATKSYNYKYNPMVQTVSGIVTSAADGLPLPGVNVVEKGTNNGVQTDFDGKYTLRTTGGKELVYSFVSMMIEELPIHSSIMNVALKEDVAALEEVVVVGYGVQPKSDNTPGYQNKVQAMMDAENFDDAAYTGAVSTLEGKVAGLNVNIRGINSISNYSEPLYVLDGVPVSKKEFENISPNSIGSVEILKGNEASGLYGSRASDGVILISTKNLTATGEVIEEGVTNKRFEIQKAYSMPSNGDITVIEIDKFSIPASYSYYAAPILNENVFLTAKIGNWEQYNLLPAEANIYFEGSYSGKTNINPQTTTDTLTVSLGVDPNVVVKRNQVNDFKKTNFIGNNRIINKMYELELKNNKQTPIDIVIMDRIPISQNKDIKVEDIETGTSQYNDDKGLMEWKTVLSPGASDTFKFSYSVKYPKYRQVNL
ncbi:DUF4139 domain-containing protein [Mangrovimonas sp. YM274]|uniref:DUF4139 domain-containing protein n=1 Tax=Mangrovimonas sp. YM274 TaxID=3070660 RepID=UPI0027DE68D0|nr:DUF4139 domain-containing protein [Mangrovimonas sp. YM274]WMI67374.1 mucoidy inhibitor MuiA family protein [Mangrovimonas sp. YM274]